MGSGTSTTLESIGQPIGDPACVAKGRVTSGLDSGTPTRTGRSSPVTRGTSARTSRSANSVDERELSCGQSGTGATDETSNRSEQGTTGKEHGYNARAASAASPSGATSPGVDASGNQVIDTWNGQPIGDQARVAKDRTVCGQASGSGARSGRSCLSESDQIARRSTLRPSARSAQQPNKLLTADATGATTLRSRAIQHYFIDDSDSADENNARRKGELTPSNSCSEGDGQTRSKVARTGNRDSTAAGSTDRAAVKPPPLPREKRLQADINSLLGSTKKARTGSGSAAHRHSTR